MNQLYTQTTTVLAREAGVLPATIRDYADRGLLEHVRLENGVRLFRHGQAARVREILAERMGNRGRRTAASA